MLSYHSFRASPRGRVVIDLAAGSVIAMEQLSRRGEPAVAAIDNTVAHRLGTLDNIERQHTGRVVRDLLEPRGWQPNPVRKRLKQGQVFTSGAVYSRTLPVGHPLDGDAGDWESRVRARGDAAVALLARTRAGNGGSVDDFIAERREQAVRDEA